MNHVQLNGQEIELVFNNCEVIYVDLWAIESLRFDVESTRFVWEPHHKELLKTEQLKSFHLEVSIDDKCLFRHGTRHIRDFSETDSVIVDGTNCIERLLHSDDLCSLYLNGICYNMPWEDKEVPADLCGTKIIDHVNGIHHSSKSVDKDGKRRIIIDIKGTTDE